MVMQDSQSRPGKPCGGNVLLRRLGVALVSAAEAVVPDEVGVLVEQGDNLRRARGRHVGGGRVEPEDGGEVSVVAEEFLDLRDGLGVQIGVEVAVLRRVPVMGDGVDGCRA